MGTLFVVATPIGNLQDITLRAVETLRRVDAVLAEDTRVTRKLLSAHAVRKPVMRLDEHASEGALKTIADLLRGGKNLAFVSDAGTPAIADSGARLISFLRVQLPDARIVPVPGVSAITAALSVAGLSANHFTFLGYPPHRKGRAKFFARMKNITIWPIVLFESPHRISSALTTICGTFGDETPVVVARELTKIYEEVFHGSISDACGAFRGERLRGEFVVIIAGGKKKK